MMTLRVETGVGESARVDEISTNRQVSVETGAGKVFVDYDENTGLFIKVLGDKANVTIKLNDKALV